jgi:hypothetical protein
MPRRAICDVALEELGSRVPGSPWRRPDRFPRKGSASRAAMDRLGVFNGRDPCEDCNANPAPHALTVYSRESPAASNPS